MVHFFACALPSPLSLYRRMLSFTQARAGGEMTDIFCLRFAFRNVVAPPSSAAVVGGATFLMARTLPRATAKTAR
jgi:hypothetical protein